MICRSLFCALVVLGLANQAKADSEAIIEAAIDDMRCGIILWMASISNKADPPPSESGRNSEWVEAAMSKSLLFEMRSNRGLLKLSEDQRTKASKKLVVERHRLRLWMSKAMISAKSGDRSMLEEPEMIQIVSKCMDAPTGNSFTE